MRESVRPVFIALFASVVCLAPPRRAYAASPASATSASAQGDIGEARAHFARGLDLYGEGKYAQARAELERAYSIAPNYRLLYDLALCSNGQGDRVAAIEYVQQYLAQGGQELEPSRRQPAEELLAQLRSQLASVTIRTNGGADVAILLDDQPRGHVADKALFLVPGNHKIWVTKEGYYPASQSVDLAGGDNIEVSFELRPLPKVAVAKPAWWSQRRVRWSAIAAVALLVATVLWRTIRARRARASGVVQLNAYQPDNEQKTPEPTPQHTNVIDVDPRRAGHVPETELALEAAVATDVGKVKPSNEDSHLLDLGRGIFVVADGIGGFAGGGVASATAVEEISSFFATKPVVGRLTHLPTAAAELVSSVFSANAAIRRKASSNINISDMGTTCVAARFCLSTGDLFIAHVGDSRAYRLRGGTLRQLTTDHTMAELGITGRRAQHLSRALGTEACPKIDVLKLHPERNDVYLLCCDGLNKMLTDEDITRVMATSPSPADAVAVLVENANRAGGLDNITAILIRLVNRG